MHYDAPTPETLSLLSSVMEEYYPDLIKNNVTVDVTMAYAKEGEPLKAGGYPALAYIKITSLKHRIKGLKDCEITIDGQIWETLTEAQQKAVVDHELHHVIVTTDKEGNTKIDDAGRAKLRLRRHDYQLGWFREVANRHGENSTECYQAKILLKNDGPTFFPKVFQE